MQLLKLYFKYTILIVLGIYCISYILFFVKAIFWNCQVLNGVLISSSLSAFCSTIFILTLPLIKRFLAVLFSFACSIALVLLIIYRTTFAYMTHLDSECMEYPVVNGAIRYGVCPEFSFVSFINEYYREDYLAILLFIAHIIICLADWKRFGRGQ